MEGVVQYQLLGSHPDASGRYLIMSFPGETTTTSKIIEQAIQEHRINMSRYKLDICKLIPVRDANNTKGGASTTPPPPGSTAMNGASGNATSADGSASTLTRDGLLAVPVHGDEELHTYDRLTITVSQRHLADDETTRKEQERLEQQRRIQEMEEELFATTTTASTMSAISAATAAVEVPDRAGLAGGLLSGSRVSPPPQLSKLHADSPRPGGRAGAVSGGPAPASDPLRLQRAAALASQLFPILKGRYNNLTGLDDPANMHVCVLCRLPAFEEMLTRCCRFPVCRSCYASAAEMDMEEGRCPVCGTKTGPSFGGDSASSATVAEAAHGSAGGHKRARDADAMTNGGWKREDGDAEAKACLQRTLGLTEESGEETRTGSRAGGPSPRSSTGVASSEDSAPATSKGTAAGGAARELQRIEDRLRHDLERALDALNGPDMISATAKAKRVMSAELSALCEQ